MAELTPPASQSNTPMRPLGPADDLDGPSSPTPASTSSLTPSTANAATAPADSTMHARTSEHDMDIDADPTAYEHPGGYDVDNGEGPLAYDDASEDEYSHSDISGDERNDAPLASDGESDEGMIDEDRDVQVEADAELAGSTDALPTVTAGDAKGKGKLDGEAPGQQQGRPRRAARIDRALTGAVQGSDSKGTKGMKNAKPRSSRRTKTDRVRGWPGQAQSGLLEGGKKDELLEQETVRAWNHSFGDPFYSAELDARVKRQLGREKATQ